MKILEVFLLSTDIPSTTSFYRDVLGLPILAETSVGVSIIAGQTILHFNHVEDINPVYHFAFNIPPKQFDSALELLKSRTELMPASDDGEVVADFKSWNAQSFYFNDNNGNILECIARFDLNDPVTSWDPKNFILNISEIAFVLDHIPAAQEYLYENGIPLFSKGPQKEDFSVLGDDEGLIILKDLQSGWMPNNLAPKAFDSRALLLQGDMEFELKFYDEELEIKQLD